MPPEEEEVALVVQRDDLSPAEHRLRREERAEESTNGETEQGVEIVENQLGCGKEVSASLRISYRWDARE